MPIIAGLLIGAVIAFPAMFPLPVCAQGQTDQQQGAAQAPTEGVLRPDVAGFLELMGRTLEASQFCSAHEPSAPMQARTASCCTSCIPSKPSYVGPIG